MQRDSSTRQHIHTKLIWSFAFDAMDDEMAERVIAKDNELDNLGFDALRLVYFQSVKNNILKFIKSLQQKGGDRRIPLMLDIALKIRATVSDLSEPRHLQVGEQFDIVAVKGLKDNDLVIDTDEWSDLFAVESTIFIGTGEVVLKCLAIDEKRVRVEVLQGEVIYPQAPVKVPRTNKDISANDLVSSDIEQFLSYNIDYIVIPGITSCEEIKKFREFLRSKTDKVPPWIILKVDTDKVYRQLPNLIASVDGILISRREIALTTNPATIPMVTKEIIQLGGENSKLVITASEILGSMRTNPTPTRAEVSDIANAVIDGADAIVLPEDLSLSRYFDRALHLVREIIADVEANTITPNWHRREPSIKSEYDALASAACRTASRVGAKAIVCLTKNGETAIRLSRFRIPIPIIAVAFDNMILKRLYLVKGVRGIMLNTTPSIDEVLPIVNNRLKKDTFLQTDDLVIFVTISLSPLGRAASNLFTVQTIK